MANRLIEARAGQVLQQSPVYHLATGTGVYLALGRAIVTGAPLPAIHALLSLLNSGLLRAIPSKGTVGASGDLTPLAHVVLCFQDVVDFGTQRGDRVPARDALVQLGLPVMDLAQRDRLALVHGTSAMMGGRC